ncbi:hypothetical protein HC256_004445 [Beauveria bassiana]|nr:hypothetical protein HC256_004445 [Beauveria bassiana]
MRHAPLRRRMRISLSMAFDFSAATPITFLGMCASRATLSPYERNLLVPVWTLVRLELHVDIGQPLEAVSDAGEILIVGDEECEAASFSNNVVQDRVGNGGAVVGACAPAKLVEDNEAAGGSGAEDTGRLGDLDHEGGLAGEEIIASAGAGVDGVAEGHFEGVGGDKGADLGEEDEKGKGAYKGRLAAHVGAGNEVGKGRGMGEGRGEGDVAAGEGLLGHGVAAIGDGDSGRGRDREETRTRVAGLSGDAGEGEQAVEGGEGGDGIAQWLVGGGEGGEEIFEGGVASGGEGLAVLVALSNELDDVGGVEAGDLFGARDFGPGRGHTLDVSIGHLDEELDAGNGDIVDGFLALELIGGDSAVLVELVLDVGDAHLVVLHVVGLVLVAEEAIFVVLARGVEVDAIEVRDDEIEDLRQGENSVDEQRRVKTHVLGPLDADVVTGYLLEGLQDGEQLRPCALAVVDADEAALQIVDGSRGLLVVELLHGGEAFLEALLVEERPADPLAQQAAAEARARLVNGPEEAAALGVVGRVAVNLERLESGAVDEHVRARAEALKMFGEVKDVLEAVFCQMSNHGRKTDCDGLWQLKDLFHQ